MNQMTSPAPKEERAACVECGVSMPLALTRVISLKPLKVKCTNEAACRKRRRQRSMRTDPATTRDA